VIQPRLVEGEIRVLGDRWSPRVHEIKNFLARSRLRFEWIDDSGPPVVLLPDGARLENPEVRELAERLGLDTRPDDRRYDLVVVGGGPAGLSAAIYASSEGLRTLVVEQEVPGGQVSFSAIVENFPGFPGGLSGSDLAGRTVAQAERFGAEILVLRRAVGLEPLGNRRLVTLDDGSRLDSRAVLLATGVTFRWLDLPGCAQLVGAGIYYGGATAEATACRGQLIHVLGGGNSAGQATLLLAQFAAQVVIMTLEDSLEQTMSHYLVERVRALPNVRCRPHTTVESAEGNRRLERLTIRDVRTGATERVRSDGLFVFIGATPRTDWLGPAVRRDAQGFVLSGADAGCDGIEWPEWPLERAPYRLETSLPGVFVAGDARYGSIKRLTSAVGEGAMVVQYVHRYISSTPLDPGKVPVDAVRAIGVAHADEPATQSPAEPLGQHGPAASGSPHPLAEGAADH